MVKQARGLLDLFHQLLTSLRLRTLHSFQVSYRFLGPLETGSMTKVDFQINNTEAGSGDGDGQGHKSEDARLQRLGVSQQLKVCT